MKEPSDLQIGTLALLALEDAESLFDRHDSDRARAILTGHDLLVRDLLPQHRGREVEKSRRFLLLFERPLEAVSFCLAYHEALRELAIELDQPLLGRVAVHMGEVFEWRNPAEHVNRGAKALEIEGPARTTVTRVMSLTLGGQTLITQAAFDLARRAAVGEAGLPVDIVWLSHGPYRFLPGDKVIDIFEVGAENTALLQAPRPEEIRRALRSPVAEGGRAWSPGAGEPMPHRPNWMLERLLGETSFGEIWLGRHRKTGDLQAFRIVSSPDHLPRMRNQLAVVRHLRSSLRGPEIAPRALASHLDDAPYYLESEYVESETLAAWAEAVGDLAAVPLVRRLEIVAQLAELVAAAHGVDVALGDIQPRSLLIRERGGVIEKILMADLSRARIVTGSADESSATPGSGQGPAAEMYLAPELAGGAPVTPEGDVFALGVLLYQLAAGDMNRPLGAFWERDVADDRLREEISRLADPDPRARSLDTLELARRLRELATSPIDPAAEQEPPQLEEMTLRGPRLFQRLLKRRRSQGNA